MFSCLVLINVSNFISYNSSYCREWKRNTECEILGFKLQSVPLKGQLIKLE